MTAYRFLATDLLSGVVREEIPFDKIQVGHVRNGTAKFTASISQRHPKATRSNLDPGRTLIVVERGGLIVGDGILWGARPSSRGKLQLTGASLWSYFHTHPGIDATRTYSQVDQLDIARDLVAYAQGRGDPTYGPAGDAAGELDIQGDSTTSGRLRDETLHGYELDNVGERVELLAARQDGFDFDVDVAWNAGRDEPVRTFETFYPRRGRRTRLVLEAGVNIEDWAYGVDARSMEIKVHGVGKGEGADMLRTTVVDATALRVWPLTGGVVTHKKVSRLETLVGHAQARLAARKRPITVPSILNVRIGPQLPFGSWVTGDEVRLKIADGWAQVDSIFRIDEWSLKVDQDGRETVDWTLVQTEAIT